MTLKSKFFFTFALCIVFPSISISAITVPANPGPHSITMVQDAVASGGDIIFKTSYTHASCNGYWIPGTDPNGGKALSIVLAAKTTAAQTVIIEADETSKWPGSNSQSFCQLRSVSF